jgi:hypothetical protein
MDDYPFIKTAALEIAYDNGMVYRTMPEDQVLRDMEILMHRDFTQEQLAAIDADLASLTSQQLVDLCTAEEKDQPKVLDITNKLLDLFFEDVPK